MKKMVIEEEKNSHQMLVLRLHRILSYIAHVECEYTILRRSIDVAEKRCNTGTFGDNHFVGKLFK
jgi:hypothetical protein